VARRVARRVRVEFRVGLGGALVDALDILIERGRRLELGEVADQPGDRRGVFLRADVERNRKGDGQGRREWEEVFHWGVLEFGGEFL